MNENWPVEGVCDYCGRLKPLVWWIASVGKWICQPCRKAGKHRGR